MRAWQKQNWNRSNTKEYEGLRRNTKEYKGIRRNKKKYEGILWNTLEYRGIRRNTKEYEGICFLIFLTLPCTVRDQPRSYEERAGGSQGSLRDSCKSANVCGHGPSLQLRLQTIWKNNRKKMYPQRGGKRYFYIEAQILP